MARQTSILALAFLAFNFVSVGQIAKADDPCIDLATDQTAPVSQWLECYRTVPFDETVRHNILDGIEDNLRNWVALTPAYRAGAVPGGEPLDILEDLTGPGTFLRTADFASDYDFHIAVINDLFGPLQNRHNAYLPPSCYNNSFWSPLALSSTTRFGNNQIVFVDLLGLRVFGGLTPAEYYRDVLGGPDVTPYDGLKVVSINGIPAVEAVRAYADRLSHSSNPSNRFNLALRTFNSRGVGLGRSDVPLDDAALDLVYVFEDRRGRQYGPVSIPLKALNPLGAADTATFLSECTAPSPYNLVNQPMAPASAGVTGLDARALSESLASFVGSETDASDRAVESTAIVSERVEASAMETARDFVWRRWRAGRYFDMPPGQPGFPIRLVEETPYVGSSVFIRVYELGGQGREKAIAIEIPSFDGQNPDWLLGIARGVNRACANDVDFLMLDLRGNTGGADAASALLRFFLFEPDQTRLVNRDPGLHLDHDGATQFRRTAYGVSLAKRSLLGSELFPEFIPPAVPLELYFDLNAQPVSAGFYDTEELVDFGNGVVEPYLERAFFNAYAVFTDAELPVNECPGRFQGERLIILDDGTSQSAAPIFVKKLRQRPVIITTGGDVASGIQTSVGHKLGGIVLIWNELAQLHQGMVQLASITGLPIAPDLPLMRAPFLRDVDLRFEQTQTYESAETDVLTRSREVQPDATIRTWIYNRSRGQELERYSYVYTKAILAARRMNRCRGDCGD